jgi:Tfp pilus assembly protein PilV
MDTTKIIVLVFLVVALILLGISVISIIRLNRVIKDYNERTAMRKKLWQWFIDEWQEMEYQPDKSTDMVKVFYYKGRYKICIWETGEASIHLKDTPDCVLSTFDKDESVLLAKLLLSKIV